MNKKLTLLSTAMLSATSLFAADKNPNIILILADDMRGTAMDFLGVEDIHTPNLDKLAAESTVFTNAHIMGGTSGAVSMPSRAMLMTGKYLYTLEKQGATSAAARTSSSAACGTTGTYRSTTTMPIATIAINALS